MEADFNAMNKKVHGVRMQDKAHKHKLIPEEIFSNKKQMADDGGLGKMLFCDIIRHAPQWPSRQLTHPIAMTG